MQPQLKQCPNCGQPAQTGAQFCSRCGANFPPQAGYGYPPQQGQVYPGQVSPDSTRLLVVILLWFFLGHFGAHRIYLGHMSTGITMLVLTVVGIATACIFVGFFFLAAVSIWWLIDLFMLITGGLQPADGSRLV
jgi:TM2 domain-containing membrane protein YozV